MSSMTMKLSERLWRLFDWRRPRPVEEDSSDAGSAALPLGPARGSRESASRRLEQGYEQVVEVMDAVKTHTRDQAERSERLLEALSDLPEAMTHLREVAESQRKMAALLQKQVTAAAEERALMNAALDRLAEAYESDRESLRVIADTLLDRKKTDGVLADRLGTLGSTLGRLDETSQASTLMLRTLAERTKRADSQVRDLYDKGRRQMTALAGVSLAVALVAVIVAGVAVVAAGSSWNFGFESGSTPAVTPPVETQPRPGQIHEPVSQTGKPITASPSTQVLTPVTPLPELVPSVEPSAAPAFTPAETDAAQPQPAASDSAAEPITIEPIAAPEATAESGADATAESVPPESEPAVEAQTETEPADASSGM